MSGSLRKLKRQMDKDADELPPAQQRLPTGRLLSEPISGKFSALPLYASVAIRDRDRIPLVMLVVALLGENVQGGVCGMLQIELPLYVETEAPTLACLDRYGWSGVVWKEGAPHWPTGDEAASEQLRDFLTEAGLRASLTFPPDSATGDVRTQPVEVTRDSGSFLMPRLVEPAEPPSEERVAAFRAIVRGYRDFYPTEGSNSAAPAH
jgi:hypothetical protein